MHDHSTTTEKNQWPQYVCHHCGHQVRGEPLRRRADVSTKQLKQAFDTGRSDGVMLYDPAFPLGSAEAMRGGTALPGAVAIHCIACAKQHHGGKKAIQLIAHG